MCNSRYYFRNKLKLYNCSATLSYFVHIFAQLVLCTKLLIEEDWIEEVQERAVFARNFINRSSSQTVRRMNLKCYPNLARKWITAGGLHKYIRYNAKRVYSFFN